MISEADMERHSLGGLKYIYTYIYIYMERHLLYGAIYGATFATWATFATFASSGLRYIGDMERHSLYMASSRGKCIHMHIVHFHNAPVEIKSSAPLRGHHPKRSMPLPVQGYIYVYIYVYIYIQQWWSTDRVWREKKMSRQTRSVAPPKRLLFI